MTDGAGRAGTSRYLLAALSLAVVAFAVRCGVAPSYGYYGIDADLLEQKQAMHRALTRGVHELYTLNPLNDPAVVGGEWNGGYFVNYPPVLVYLRYLPVVAYRTLSPAGFAAWDSELNYYDIERTDMMERLAQSRGFTVAVKLPGIVADAVIAWLLALHVGRRLGASAGLGIAAGWALNPGIIVNTAFWGQQDSVWALFLIASLLALCRGHVARGWVLYGLALLTKPQAVGYALVVASMGWLRATPRVLAGAIALGLATATAVFLPFLLHGTFVGAVTSIFRSVYGGEPFVSCNAANAWWLLTLGRGYEVSDLLPVLGPLTPRRLGLAAFLVANVLAWRRLRDAGDDAPRVFLTAAFVGMTFFTFSTELHENHMMAVLPLCAFALPLDRRLGLLFAALSVTFLLNLVLFDPALHGPLARAAGVATLPLRGLSVAAAGVNTAACFALGWLFWRRTAPPGARA